MKIAVDANELIYKDNTGVKVYTHQILQALAKIDNQNEYTLYTSKKISGVESQKIVVNDNFKIEVLKSFLPFWTYSKFLAQIKKSKPDLLFMPIQAVPFFKKPAHIKIVVTVHDLAYLVYPDFFTKKDRTSLDFHTKRAVKMADAIIVPSLATQQDLIKYHHENKEKIHLIYHGTVPLENRELSGAEKEDLNGKVANLKPFILFVGTIQPRKNIIRLIEAFERVKSRQDNYADLKLVIVGKKGWLSEGIYNRANKSQYSPAIIFTGSIDNSYLRKLYENALMFVLPSLYEGFGLPVLEAMSFGLPCIVSDNSSLAEIVDSHALVVNAQSSDDLAQKINIFLNHENLRHDYSVRSIKNASFYTWEKSARKLLNVFEQLK